MSTLYAIYDLRVSPPSYDFAIFLQCAELQRKRYHLDDMYVWIIKGKRIAKMPLSEEEGTMMLNNIVIPMCSLIPSIVSVCLMPEGTQVPDVMPEHMYPLGYTSNYPQPGFALYNLLACIVRGERPTHWQPPIDAVHAINRLINQYVKGKKFITVNLRENPDVPTRNSNLAEWKEFVAGIDPEEYVVFVIRETENIYSPLNWDNCIELPTAALNLHHRAALCSFAYINLFVANGPMVLSFFSVSKTIIMKPRDESNKSTSKNWFETIQGMTIGGQLACLTKKHRYFWKNDTARNIRQAFDIMHDEIDDYLNAMDVQHLTNTLAFHLKWRFFCIVAEEDIQLMNLLPLTKDMIKYIFQDNQQAFELVFNREQTNGISNSR